jgi:phosphatidylglycerol:prolipoprotein diacylglycerol transferase
MYPHINIGSLQLSSFSLMMLLAFLVATWLGVRQAQFLRVEADVVLRLLPWAAVGGLAGAQVYSVAGGMLHGQMDIAALWARRGQVFYGGLIAGTLVTMWRFRRTGLPQHLLFDYGAPCVAIGHAIGRIGCFLVGDDYGMPTTLPWGVAFPLGAPPSTAAYLRSMGASIDPGILPSTVMSVHPVQLYEAAVLTVLGVVLWRASRRPHRAYSVFAAYAVTYGAWRLGIEWLRPKDDHLPIGITSAQLISVVLLTLGALIFMRRTTAATPTA